MNNVPVKKNDRNIVQFGQPNLDVNSELDYLKEDLERAILAQDTIQTGTQTTTVVVA
jgi:hypothetical protein